MADYMINGWVYVDPAPVGTRTVRAPVSTSIAHLAQKSAGSVDSSRTTHERSAIYSRLFPSLHGCADATAMSSGSTSGTSSARPSSGHGGNGTMNGHDNGPPPDGYLTAQAYQRGLATSGFAGASAAGSSRRLEDLMGPSIKAEPGVAHAGGQSRSVPGGGAVRAGGGMQSAGQARRHSEMSDEESVGRDGSGGGGSKAGAGGAGGPGSGEKKRKKPRVALSCAQCTKRKQKCNRNIPCQHCIQRKIPDLCVPYVPGEPIASPSASTYERQRQASTSRSATHGAQSPTTSPMTQVIAPAPGSAPQRPSMPVPQSAPSVPLAAAARPAVKPQNQTSRPLPLPSKDRPDLNGPVQVYASNEAFQEALKRLNRVESILGIQAGGSPQHGGRRYDEMPAPQAIRGSRSSQGGSAPRSESDDPSDPGQRSGTAIIGAGFSRSTSAGEGVSVDAGKWFVTASTVPNIEGLRAPGGTVKLDLADCGTPAENLQRLISECGVSPLKLRELVEELPPYQFAKDLVDYFFRYIDYVRYPIHEEGFRQAFEDLYAKKGHIEPEPGNVRSLPLIFIVLATASRLAPEEWAGDDKARRLNSLRMYWCSRRSILIATAIQPESLELVVTRLLSGLYLALIHDRRLTECWSQLGASLRTAQAIGLHRDGTKLGLDPFQTEYRRRVWSYLYHADRNWSLVLGRPPSIDDAYCDTKEPTNVEWADIKKDGPTPSRPLNEPTTATFVILRKRFAMVQGKVVRHFQKLHEPARYEDVELLDKEIRKFIKDLPPHYRMEDPDKSLDSERFYIPIHRYYLATEIVSIIITLHRPWLLRRLRSDKFVISRRACFEAAKADFRIRTAFRRDYPGVHSAYFGGQFREFNAAMIAGIAAIIFPRSEEADEMRAILQTFLENNSPDSQAFRRDHTSRKEYSIIRTLHRRALEVLDNDVIASAGHPSESVALLLGLRSGADQPNGAAGTSQPGKAPGAGTGKDDTNLAHFNKVYQAVVQSGMPASAQGQALKSPVQATHNVGIQQNLENSSKKRTDSMSGNAISPSSTLTGEDERPQKLLDLWLSTNNSLAVPSSTDAMFADLMGLDTFMGAYPDAGSANNDGLSQGFASGYPGQVQNSLYPTGPFPSAGPGRYDSGNPSLASQAYPTGAAVDGTLLSLTGAGSDGTGAGQYGGFAMDRSASGSASQAAGLDSNMLVDDSYWNALIDGIIVNATYPGGPDLAQP